MPDPAPPPAAPTNPAIPMEHVSNPYRMDEPIGGDTQPQEVIPTQDAPPAPLETAETPQVPSETPQEPGTKGEKHYSRAELRAQLDERNLELDKLRSEGSMRTQQYTDALAKQEELHREIKQRDESYIKDRVPVYDPAKDPEVAKPREEIFEILTDNAAEMSAENAETFKKDIHHIIKFYGEGRSRGDAALRQVRDKLTEIFGEDGPTVFKAMKDIYPRYKSAAEAEEKNSITHFDRTREGYEKRRRTTVEDFSKIGKWTKEQIEANPDDPDAVISAAIGGDEEILKNLEVLTHKAAQHSVGPPPLPPNPTPEMVAQHRTREKEHNQFLQSAYRRDVQVRALTAVVKHLLDERNGLLKRVTSASPANRADITPEGARPTGKTNVPMGGEFAEIQNPFRNT